MGETQPLLGIKYSQPWVVMMSERPRGKEVTETDLKAVGIGGSVSITAFTGTPRDNFPFAHS